MAETKVRYNRGYVEPINRGEQGDARGSLELWCNGPLEITTAANGKRVGHISCNGTFAKSSGINYALGDDVLAENGHMFVNVTIWEPLLNYVEKMNLDKGKRVQVYGRFTKQTFARNDGSTGTSVACTARKVELKWPIEEGKSEQVGGYVDRAVQDTVGKGVGSLALWVNGPAVFKTTPSGNEVAELNCNGRFIANSGIPYALGEDILDPKDGNMFVKCTGWRYAVDSLKRLNLQKGARVQIYGTFEVEEFKRGDGTIGKNVVCRDIKKLDVLSFGANSTTAPAASAPAPAPEAPVVPDDDQGFQAPTSFGDVVVPF